MPSLFRRRLGPPPEGPRRWFYVAYDQLSDRIGPWAEVPAEELGLVLVESADKPARRPYHQQKLALILSNQRHFALEQADRGVAIDYRFTEAGYAVVWFQCGEGMMRAGVTRGPESVRLDWTTDSAFSPAVPALLLRAPQPQLAASEAQPAASEGRTDVQRGEAQYDA